MTNAQIQYQQVAWMQPLKDVKSNKIYYMLGLVTNPEYPNTFAVTPQDGKGQTMFFCIRHQTAYGLRDVCLDCRMQVTDAAVG